MFQKQFISSSWKTPWWNWGGGHQGALFPPELQTCKTLTSEIQKTQWAHSGSFFDLFLLGFAYEVNYRTWMKEKNHPQVCKKYVNFILYVYIYRYQFYYNWSNEFIWVFSNFLHVQWGWMNDRTTVPTMSSWGHCHHIWPKSFLDWILLPAIICFLVNLDCLTMKPIQISPRWSVFWWSSSSGKDLLNYCNILVKISNCAKMYLFKSIWRNRKKQKIRLSFQKQAGHTLTNKPFPKN